MPKPEITKRFIADNYQELVESRGGDSKITVLDIVDRCGVNRKTFYYHFENKADLIKWKFRFELGSLLFQEFGEDFLVYTDEDFDDKYHRYPYYARKVYGNGAIDGSMFFELLARYLEKQRRYYHSVLLGENGAALRNYLVDLYAGALMQDAQLMLGGEISVNMPIDMLSRYFASASVGWLLNMVMYESYPLYYLFQNECANITHEAMGGFIHAHPDWLANMK